MNINRYYNIESAGIVIENIPGPAGEVLGTRVTISLPLNIDIYEYEEDKGSHH